ncbi:MAG: squalene/phytoene synthase family protein [Planctomycetota bacterium]|jgi:farnesyl-diphosphate farnesyltransferase
MTDDASKRESLRLCWQILPRVSRSFAIPIRMLPGRTGDAVMLSYLIFRIADTIEDACPGEEERERLFGSFRALLDGDRSQAAALAALAPPPYDMLMKNTGAVADSFDGLSPEVRGIILTSLDEMAEGMQAWSTREVRSLPDLHDYCYYVAGIVGKLLTRIFRAHGHIGGKQYRELAARAVDFGIALQMINVIRDVRTDAREGRRFWPTAMLEGRGVSWDTLFDAENRDRAADVLRQLIGDALDHCDRAFEYLTLLPRWALRVRLFCALPLYMAVSTLRRCFRDPALFSGDRPVKITRRKTRHIFALSILLAPLNGLLASWYRRLRRFDAPVPQTP